jgi:hypothetical protein
MRYLFMHPLLLHSAFRAPVSVRRTVAPPRGLGVTLACSRARPHFLWQRGDGCAVNLQPLEFISAPGGVRDAFQFIPACFKTLAEMAQIIRKYCAVSTAAQRTGNPILAVKQPLRHSSLRTGRRRKRKENGDISVRNGILHTILHTEATGSAACRHNSG